MAKKPARKAVAKKQPTSRSRRSKRETFQDRLHDLLRKSYPDSFLIVEPAYGDAFSVKIIDKQFNGKAEPEKQELVWNVIQRLADDAKRVRWVIVYGADEL